MQSMHSLQEIPNTLGKKKAGKRMRRQTGVSWFNLVTGEVTPDSPEGDFVSMFEISLLCTSSSCMAVS